MVLSELGAAGDQKCLLKCSISAGIFTECKCLRSLFHPSRQLCLRCGRRVRVIYKCQKPSLVSQDGAVCQLSSAFSLGPEQESQRFTHSPSARSSAVREGPQVPFGYPPLEPIAVPRAPEQQRGCVGHHCRLPGPRAPAATPGRLDSFVRNYPSLHPKWKEDKAS